MNRLLIIGLLTGILLGTAGCGRQSDSSVTQLETRPRAVEYFRASHGFDGGLQEMVDLSKREGFDAIRTIDEVARFASEVPGAVGFTAHPDFENGTRYASAVMWYTKLSPTESSWVLYLFDKKEAQKHPGDAPRAAAVTAAEAKVSSQIDEARELIAAGGTNGVKVVGDPDECKALALAVLRLGGLFAHTGEFAVGRCVECRNVVPGGKSGGMWARCPEQEALELLRVHERRRLLRLLETDPSPGRSQVMKAPTTACSHNTYGHSALRG